MKRRTLLQVATAGAVAGLGLAPAATAATGPEEALPTPPPPPASVPTFGTTTKPDGTPLAVVVAGGLGGTLNVIDLSTGRALPPRRLADTSNPEEDTQAWGFVTLTGEDRGVVIGASKRLYLYNPRTDEVTDLSRHASYAAVEGSFTQIWDMAVDEHDNVYIATAAAAGRSAPVLTWNAQDGWGALPGGAPVAEGTQNARCIDYAKGKVYVGTGPQDPQVYEIDVASGAKRPLPLPTQDYAADAIFPTLEEHGGVLYVRSLGRYGTTAYDLATGESHHLANYGERFVPRPGEDTKIYHWHQGRSGPAYLYEYDPTTRRRTAVIESPDLLGRLSPRSWATHEVFVSGTMSTGELSVSRSGSVTRYPDLLVSADRRIQAMTAAEDGSLYASWYMSAPALLRVSPGARASQTAYEIIAAPNAQAEGLVAADGYLVTGLYPDGYVSARPLSAAATAPTGKVPIGHQQDRPYAVISLGGGRFALGSVPVGGRLGGALTIYDAAKGGADDAVEVFPFPSLDYAAGVDTGLLSQLSPISLAHREGRIYMGTTVRGGQHNTAPEQQAYVVEFDLASRSVTRIVPVFEGQAAVTALTAGPDGALYGTTGEYLFSIDASYRVTGHSLSPGHATEPNRSGGIVCTGGRVFGLVNGVLYDAPTSDLSAARAVPGESGYIFGLVLGSDGYLYYSRHNRLFRCATS